MKELLPPVMVLVFAYAVTFGIQNKVPWLYRFEWLHKFLGCTYCVGFHAGWVTWLIAWAIMGTTPAEGWHIIPSILLWALTSSAFCYALDATVKYLENNSVLGDLDEEEEEEMNDDRDTDDDESEDA